MAEVRLSRFAIRRKSRRVATEIVDRVLDEVLFEAFIIARSGQYATGRLAQSLHKVGPRPVGLRVEGSVRSDLNYAASVHNGAEIHQIFPRAAPHVYRFGSRRRPQLKFFWRRVGRVVFLPHIPGARSRIGRSHPGIAHGKHFLTIPLRDAARRHNLRVVTRF